MKIAILFLLSSVVAFAQTTVTIPAYTVTAPLVINGVPSGSITVPIPAQTFTVPAATLPTGLSYSAATGLTVAGPISATQLSLTGGTVPATSSTGFYVFSLAGGIYSLVPLPSISVTALSSPNTFTITP